MNKKNIIFIMTDQQHFDSLGCNGTKEARTPNIDKLAEKGVNFKNHIVTNPVCSPSRASIITGKYISEHGVWTNGCDMPKEQITIPKALKGGGYESAHFGKLHLVGLVDRIGEHPDYGFDICEVAEGDQNLLNDCHWRWLKEYDAGLYDMYLEEKNKNMHGDGYKSVLTEVGHHSTWVTNRTVDYIKNRRDKDKPFYLSVGYFDPHHTFDPVEPYWSMFENTDMPEPKFQEGDIEGKPLHYQKFFEGCKGGTRNPEKIMIIRRAFHAMMAHVDKCVGDIVRTLEEQGLEKETLIIFTSDHGEFMGNHGLLWKGPFMLDDLMRVPLIISDPAGEIKKDTCNEITSGVDILPTILGLAGVELPDMISGKPIMNDKYKLFPDGKRGYALAEWENNKDIETSSIRMLRKKDYKLIYYNNCTTWGELYDLKNDPDEFINLYNNVGYQSIKNDLIEELKYIYTSKRPSVHKKHAW